MVEKFYWGTEICIYELKIRVVTFDTNHSVTDSTQKINRCFIPKYSRFCEVSTARHGHSYCVRRNDQVIEHFEDIR
jgi:hypothetical protein